MTSTWLSHLKFNFGVPLLKPRRFEDPIKGSTLERTEFVKKTEFAEFGRKEDLREGKNMERFTNLRVILAQGPC